MAYNGILLNSLLTELKEKLIGGRINKIYQPSDKELTFTIRSNGNNHLLYVSAHSNYAQVNLIDSKLENPVKPPNFCMLMRKHLQNGIITNIEQLGLERIVVFHIDSSDELGYVSTKRLVVEIMGKHSNIILINDKDIIYDSIKRISPFMSKIRQIMPNQPFEFIKYDKENITNINKESFLDSLYNFEKTKTSKYLYLNFQGLGPKIAKEICNRSDISFRRKNKDLTDSQKDALYKTLLNFKEIISNKDYIPYLVINKTTNEPEDFSPIFLETYNNDNYYHKRFNSFSKLVREYYDKKLRDNIIKQKSSNLTSLLNKKIHLLESKITNLNKDLAVAENADEYQIKGELITANIYKLKKGMECVTLENYYDNNNLVEVELSVNKTPSQNAQKYFKKYNKLKTAQIEVKKQLNQSKDELDYLENVLNSIENAEDVETIDEIKHELIESNYINKKKNKKKKKKKIKDNFKKYTSSDGFDIYAGKNNKQNDYLTLKFANNDDLWFHTKDLPGTHVVIKTAGREVPQLTLDEAAIIAAYNSKGKMSSNVPVDYTLIKHVSKPSGAKPGMVIYVKNHTLYVTPSIKKVNELKDEE